MKHQLIPAIGLAAIMAWCGYQIAQAHPPQEKARTQQVQQPPPPQSAPESAMSTPNVNP